MKKLTLAAIASLTISGCASTSTPQESWVSTIKVDEFTDEVTCTVVAGTQQSNGFSYSQQNRYYPVIKSLNGELLVGVTSGGTVPLPVGNVQLRVDGNDTWTIEASETPVDGKNSLADVAYSDSMTEAYTTNMSAEQKAQYLAVLEATKKNTAGIMSPETLATGDKAKAILEQIKTGTELKVRVLGFGMQPSTTGRHVIDQSLIQALKECGIK